MENKNEVRLIFQILFLCVCLAGLWAANLRADEESKYLKAVREFADNVLKYGRDTYGPKQTPLFVDGLNVNTHEPVKWIAPNGDRWILSNLASQQNLFRTLDGLTMITGDPKYKQAAMDAIKYAFTNLRSKNGLLYWGGSFTYDANGDRVCSDVYNHSLRYHYPYYKLMWEVTPDETKNYVESLWAAHILDWSNLDMNRYGPLDSYKVAKGWGSEYKGGSVFFVGRGIPHFATGSDLFYAAAILSKSSNEKEPLVWAKRLAHRYVETRDPNTGIAGFMYAISEPDAARYQFGDDFKGHIVLTGKLFPDYPKFFAEPEALAFPVRGWICMLLLGDLLGSDGKEFKTWALEELTAWGKVAYRAEDNSLIPMLTDGTSLEGYVLKRDGYYGAKGTVFKAWHPQGLEFWAYAMAYRVTENQFMWEMARNIAKGNDFGDIGVVTNDDSKLNTETNCVDPYALLGFLELCRKTGKTAFLEMASRVGDNILTHRFHKGFFVPSKRNIYTRFDTFEPLALLHLFAVIESKSGLVPWVWPGESWFACDYRERKDAFDVDLIYTLTDLPEPSLSLHEAAATGNFEQVKSLLSEGAGINSRERAMWTPLHRAVMNGHKRVVELLLAEGADVDARNSFGASALHCAVERDHKDVVELLTGKGANANATTASGDTPLQYAAYANNREIIQLLLEKGATIATIHLAVYMGDLAKIEAFTQEGANINVLDGHGYAPLHYAVQNSQKQAIELLIVKGADTRVENWQGQTPLDIALSRNQKDIVELLLTKGADVNTTNAAGDTPLHYTLNSQNTDKEIVELLIAKGANINAKNSNGRTPLDIALIRNQKDIVGLLLTKGAGVSTIHAAVRLGDADKTRSFLEKGIDVNTRDENGATPLHLATNKDVVELLIVKGADVNAKDKNDCTPLHSAVKEGRQDVAELLVVKGADINAKDKSEYTPLCYAVLGKQKEIIKLLVTKGADVNFTPKDGYPPLCFAVWFQDKEMVELLVAHGAKFDVKDQGGWTAFRYAAAQGSRDILEIFVSKGADVSTLHMAACVGDSARVRSLLEQGANVDTKDELGWTPLYWAASTGQAEVAELLITKGADIQAKTNDEGTPLHQASTCGSEELVKLLISNKADVNAKDKNGKTPLHNSVSSGNRAIVELLLAKGASINAQNRNNRTPLHLAAIRGQKEIVEVLIAKGADISAKDTRGLTPLRLAENQKRTEIAELLRKHGAKE